ncbi:MAG: putative selenate reductase subunit YgfK [Anaerolineae bacterium]|jgi:putative selenate reductase
MSGEMRVLPFEDLLRWVLAEYEENQSIFGIHRSLFYTPRAGAPYATEDLFGHSLATPVGPAAGPHTQLAQNIVSAWLCGGRFIELKTVQIMDELEIPRPCIDMADEGYNVEWSQELKLDQSAEEYIHAWVLIHVLRRLLGLEGTPFGTIFNMSVGYNLEGIQTPPMQRFMDRMEDAAEEIDHLQEILRRQFPQFAGLSIPARLTNSVTLSTMHGCPPDEIEAIARYLVAERGLHTFVKLNPTLLGQETVMEILHDHLGYGGIHIPDSVFEHDLKYGRAVALISTLQEVAAEKGVRFGIKLSNTLAMANHRDVLPGEEMYMSGRALYPVTMNLFDKLMREFDGDLDVSCSAGADALNVATVLSCGALTVTAASDLLKPGGYGRLGHWLDKLEAEMDARGAGSLKALAEDRLANLAQAAAEALKDPRYKKSYHPFALPKVESGLDRFDCIVAPCMEQCAVCQDVPDYAWLIAQGEYDRALEVILRRNPLPGITGYVCTHLCQTRCTRSNYDQPVLIRNLKRFAAEKGRLADWGIGELGGRYGEEPSNQSTDVPKVAVIGSGPAGLSAAYFLALNGVQATIFEAREVPGGMCAIAPPFRIPPSVVQADIERITALGAELVLNHRVAEPPEELLKQGFEAVYLATGFQRDAGLDIPGIDGQGVFTALRFLEAVMRDEKPDLGDRVLVIGGGNTAMDAARTAQRLTGRPSTVVYRRTLTEMPAETEELEWLFEEGNELIELASPVRVVLEEGRAAALECVRNELGEPGPDGRRRPVPVPGSEFQIGTDAERVSIILAIGQKPDLGFLDEAPLTFHRDGRIVTDPATRTTEQDRVYAGGDVTRGPEIIIAACEDGRRAAEAICRALGIRASGIGDREIRRPSLSEGDILAVKQVRARKIAQHEPGMLPVARRDGFACVEQTLSEADARAEAARCLQCATFCDKCVEVCPNRANYTYLVEPMELSLPVLACRDGELAVVGEEAWRVTQTHQIVHVEDLCNLCGNCATFCVHQGKPYADKPRLFLDEGDFQAEDDNAFYIEGPAEAAILRRREDGREARLAVENGSFLFEDDRVRVRLSGNWETGKLVLKEAFEGEVSLKAAAEMGAILKGVTGSLAFLLTGQR